MANLKLPAYPTEAKMNGDFTGLEAGHQVGAMRLYQHYGFTKLELASLMLA